MSDPIRLLHFADVHVGMENYGRLDPSTGTSSRVRDFLDRLDEMIDHALEQEADLAVFAGDAFKNRDPEPTQQREFARRIKRLSDSIPTLLLVGNHDMPGMASKANSLDIFRALDVPGVMVGHTPEGQVVETRRGPVYLAWMPYPMRNRLLSREEHHQKSIDELEVTLRGVVSAILQNLADEADQHDMPRVLVGHFSVAEAEYGSERSVMLGREVAVFKSTLADSRWDYVALGHIHRHQNINPEGYPAIVYCGSLERIDFGEEGEAKGYCWVELERGETKWSFKPVAARPFTTVRVDVRGKSDPTAAVLSEVENLELEEAVVRVIIQLSEDQEPALRDREIEAVLTSTAHLSIVREVDVETRTRLGDLAPEALSPLELIEHYFQSKDIAEERITSLLSAAEDLLEGDGGE